MKGFVSALTGTLAVDQLTKLILLETVEPVPVLPPADSFVNISIVKNRGLAWGLFSEWPSGLTVLAAAVVIALILVLVLRGIPRGRAGLGMGFLVGGAISNLLDRLRYGGSVVDFIDVGVGRFRWPTFNLADAAITAGVVLIVLGTVGRGVKQLS